MAYFNRVTRIAETLTTSTMTAQYDGSWVQEDIVLTTTYRCEECKLVWSRYGQAQQCKARAHRNQFLDTYYSQVVIEDKVHIVETSYPRRAIRRDGPKPVQAPVQTPAKAPSPAAPAPVLSLAQIKDLALEHGYRLSRIPQAKAPVTPSDEGVAETPETPVF